MERWIRIGIRVTALVMIAVLGFFAWTVVTDPRRTDAAIGVTTVEVSDNAFTPFVIEVDTGIEVTFAFVGAIEHNVSFDDGVESADMVSGRFARSFEQPGVYDFVCTLHPLSMRGRVVAVDG